MPVYMHGNGETKKKKKKAQHIIYGISSHLVETECFDSTRPCFLCKYNTIKLFSAGNKILENQSRFGHFKR